MWSVLRNSQTDFSRADRTSSSASSGGGSAAAPQPPAAPPPTLSERLLQPKVAAAGVAAWALGLLAMDWKWHHGKQRVGHDHSPQNLGCTFQTFCDNLAQNLDCVFQRVERYSLRAQGGEAHISEAEKAELETIMKLLSRLDDIDKKMAVPGEPPHQTLWPHCVLRGRS
eukprot:COSAG04_NODE_7_length_45988_cov_220.188869_7_plen_169_part_00